MLNLLIPIIVVGTLFYFNLKIKRNWIAPSSMVFNLFFLSLLLAYPYMQSFDEVAVLQSKYLESSLCFSLLVLVYFVPFLLFREDQIKTIELPNRNFLYLFSIFICLLSLYSVVYFFSLSIDALTNSDIAEARNAYVKGEGALESRNIFLTIAATSASFYQIPIILFFIFEILNQQRVLKWLLFISSFSYVLYVLSAFGRDGVVFWFISFIGIMGFFYSFLTFKFKKKMKVYLTLFSVLGGVFFLIISFSRFGDETYSYLISYMGQSLPNFCLAYEAHAPITNWDIFPLFRSFLGLSENVDSDYQSYLLELSGTYSYVFGTLFNSFMLSLGFLGTILLSIIFYIIFKITVKKKNFSFANLLIYTLFYQIFSQGVFYFHQSNRPGNLVIIVSFILYLVFTSKIKYGNNNMYINSLSIGE